jgi:SDR family mycofactocin-dependent oxidoreductase
MDMGRVNGKIALVTGAARGQGRSHAVLLAEEGADLIVIDMCDDIETNGYALSSVDDLAETVALVEKFDRRVVSIQADVRELSTLKSQVDRAVAELGGLDIVCANAGICPLGRELPVQAWADAVDVDLTGVNNTISATLRHLKAGAAIVLTGSVAGLVSGGTDSTGPGGAGYSFSKRTIVSIVTELGRVLAPHSIRINAVHPTNCNTDMLQSEPMYRIFRPDLEDPSREDAELAFPAMNAMPVGYVEPIDISQAVVYLASDESRYVTGQNLAIDAGALLKAPPALG